MAEAKGSSGLSAVMVMAKKLADRTVPKLNCYRYSSASAKRVLAQLERLGIENTCSFSEAGYLAIRFERMQPWEFHFVTKGAIARLKQLPAEASLQETANAFIGDGVKLVSNPNAPAQCQRTKRALKAWLQGDYQTALTED